MISWPTRLSQFASRRSLMEADTPSRCGARSAPTAAGPVGTGRETRTGAPGRPARPKPSPDRHSAVLPRGRRDRTLRRALLRLLVVAPLAGAVPALRGAEALATARLLGRQSPASRRCHGLRGWKRSRGISTAPDQGAKALVAAAGRPVPSSVRAHSRDASTATGCGNSWWPSQTTTLSATTALPTAIRNPHVQTNGGCLMAVPVTGPRR